MKRSLATRNRREIRRRESAIRRESSVKKCHVVSCPINDALHETPRDGFAARKQRYVQVHRTASKSDFHFSRPDGR